MSRTRSPDYYGTENLRLKYLLCYCCIMVKTSFRHRLFCVSFSTNETKKFNLLLGLFRRSFFPTKLRKSYLLFCSEHTCYRLVSLSFKTDTCKIEYSVQNFFLFGGRMPLILFIFDFYNIHTFIPSQYIHPSPFAEASLHILIACVLSGEDFPVVPSRESNPGTKLKLPRHRSYF